MLGLQVQRKYIISEQEGEDKMYKSLKRYRNFFGFTQVKLAEEIGMPVGSYRAKEQGRVSFSDEEKLKIKEVFLKLDPKVTIDTIFFE